VRRTLWFAAGAGAGVYALTKARRIAEAFTAEGLGDRLAGLSVGARLFREEVLAGAAEAESGVRERLGVPAAPGRPQLAAAPTGGPTPSPGPSTGPAAVTVPSPTTSREATH
jgi:hypothetical protein